MHEVLYTRGVIRECASSKAQMPLCVSVATVLQSIFDQASRDPKQPLVNWGNSLILERVCVSSVIIYKSKQGYRLGCTCCGKDVHVDNKGNFQSIHDAMKEVPYSSVMHRIASGLAQEDKKADGISDFTYPYRFKSKDIMKNSDISPCDRDLTKHDSCVGDDQLILSSILNEKKFRGRRALDLWVDIVDGAFMFPKDCYHKFQEIFEKILTGALTPDDVMTLPVLGRSITIKKNDSWQPSEFELISQLQTNINSVMLVDWLDPSLPTTVPEDFEGMSSQDMEILSNILSGDSRFK